MDKFVPGSVLDAMKAKDIRKMITHYMKANLNLAPGQKQITPLQAKLHYMKIISELRTFGGKCFMATLVVSIFYVGFIIINETFPLMEQDWQRKVAKDANAAICCNVVTPLLRVFYFQGKENRSYVDCWTEVCNFCCDKY